MVGVGDALGTCSGLWGEGAGLCVTAAKWRLAKAQYGGNFKRGGKLYRATSFIRFSSFDLFLSVLGIAPGVLLSS